MPVAQSPAHYINSSKGCPSITESFSLVVILVLCATVSALPVVQIMPSWSLFVQQQKAALLFLQLSHSRPNTLFVILAVRLSSLSLFFPFYLSSLFLSFLFLSLTIPLFLSELAFAWAKYAQQSQII
jgi:hypothetical protein